MRKAYSVLNVGFHKPKILYYYTYKFTTQQHHCIYSSNYTHNITFTPQLHYYWYNYPYSMTILILHYH